MKIKFKIEHIAIWVKDLDKMKEFYQTYFGAKSSNLYHNQKTGFKSYFLTFDNGCRVELMNKSDISQTKSENNLGYAHISFSVGSKDNVDLLTDELRKNDVYINTEPRTTGDGYYESSILDPEGNVIEITE